MTPRPDVRHWLAGLCAIGLLLLGPAALALVDVPKPALVVDLTGSLSNAQQVALTAKLARLEVDTGSQIAVLMVPSTAPEDIAQFGIRVADAWKVGRPKIDDGLILIVAKDDHRARIEVGYGLEGAVTDLVSHRVIEEALAPNFRRGDYYAGIDQAVDRLIGIIGGEALPAPPPRAAHHARGSFGGLLPLLLIFGVVVGQLASGMLGRPVGALVTGGAAGFLAFVFLQSVAMALFAGIGAAVLALLGGMGGFGGFGGFGGGFRGGDGGGIRRGRP